MTRRRATLVLTACLAASGLAALTVPSSASVTSSAHLSRQLAGSDSGAFPGSEVPVGDVDRRGPRLVPFASARAELARLGGDLNVSWTQYGTPLVVTKDKGFLATGLPGAPKVLARAFLKQHRDLYGLSARDVDALELVSDAPMSQGTDAFSVQFRQLHAGLPLAEDGYVTVGLGKGNVALVTSSLVPTNLLGSAAATSPKLSVQQAVLAAAKDAGVTRLALGDLTVGKTDGAGFTTVSANGLHQLQRTRLRVLPTTDRGARLVYETNITDIAGGRTLATIGFVDAIDGTVLLRRDAVDTAAEGTAANAGQRSISTQAAASPGSFEGTYSATKCSAAMPLDTAVGDRNLVISAIAFSPANDIVITVQRNGTEIGSIDTLASPEAGTASFTPPIRAVDKITARVCPFDGLGTAPFDFAGNYVTTDQSAPSTALPGPLTDGTDTGPATWRVFASNPQLPRTPTASKDDRYLACSGKQKPASNVQGKNLSACSFVYTDGSPLPYDADPVTGLPTFTTAGNNALTSDARLSSSLTPGAPFLPPVSPTRDYTAPFADGWHTSKCDPTSVVSPVGTDIQAAILNLFVGHNRIHDFAYRLGLTEPRGAMQVSNFGKGGAAAKEGDPELGNTQNAAATNNAFTATNQATVPASGVGLTGRNNANQVTLQDGVPGITNQYLFQPVVGFYGPCADGDLDASIFLHEYTHAISNRLIAGPDTGLSGQQGGSMGESWSDLVAIEYLNAFGLAGSRGEDPYSIGAYATGDPVVGIRDYNLSASRNPLNYSDFGFDSTGPEVHADGEIWNAVQMEVRQALVRKYDAKYPSTNKVLQKACALGRTASGAVGPKWNKCPGNRRYVTYMFDSLYLQANGAPSMVDMKNVELAAVMLRDPADYDTVADAFAVRGLGKGSVSRTTADTDPTPSFASPKDAKNARVTFKLRDAATGKPVKGQVFVGMYHARCTPVATTLGGKQAGPTARLIKGKYTFTVQARGYGIQRFTATYQPGARTQVFALRQNLASSAYGPTVTGNAGALRLGRAFDDSETSTAAFDAQPVAGRQITVKFGGGKATFQRLGVSSLHHLAEKLPEGGTEFTGRLLGIRAFDLQASSNGGRTFSTIYRSPADFFPANRPRAVAPDLIMREIRLPKPVTADTVRLVIRGNNCTTNSQFNVEQEADPTNDSDCRTVATNTTRVTVTELQVLRGTAPSAAKAKAAAKAAPVAVAQPTTRAPLSAGPTPANRSSSALALGGLLLAGLAGVGFVLSRLRA